MKKHHKALCSAAGAMAAASTTLAGAPNPDVTFCELYGLQQFGRVGDVVGMSLATTSWNVGNADLIWQASPDPDHPMIVMNLYRLSADGHFDQVGQSWIKHGFFALSNTQCGGQCTFEPGNSGGDWLGQNCTDTYGSGLNASQSGLGPRFEVNPWTGGWDYQGSMFQVGGPPNNGIRRRLQVHDADIDPAQNPGAIYFAEGYYVHKDDTNVMNSAAHKEVSFSGSPGGNWGISMSPFNDFPKIGFALTSWEDAQMFTTIAEEVPVIEFQSPDGRNLLGSRAVDLGDGTYQYFYSLLNIDMHRQVGSFSLSLDAAASISDVRFHSPEHHDEPLNVVAAEGGIPIDNADWVFERNGNTISWSTTSNPLRWGVMNSFSFITDQPPVEDNVTLGVFRPDTVNEITGIGIVPNPGPVAFLSEIVQRPGDFVDPNTTTSVVVNATPENEQITSVTLNYRFANLDGTFNTQPMIQNGSDWTGTIPGADCNERVEYFVEVLGSGGSTKVMPLNAPEEVLFYNIGTEVLALEDDIETDNGWTVGLPSDDATTGIWDRADPEGTATNDVLIQPEDDHTPGAGTICWVTGSAAGNSVGDNDVDNGTTTLTSPVFELEQYTSATIGYWRWYSNSSGASPGNDVFVVQVSSDGTNWVNVETVGPTGLQTTGGWNYNEFVVNDFVSLNNNVQVRFIASDLNGGSLVEAAIDDLRIVSVECSSIPTCDGDLDGDNDVDSDDLGTLLGAFGTTDAGDVDGDGDTDSDDLGLVLGAFGNPC